MIFKEMFNKFEKLFPMYAGENIDTWFLHTKNSIRIRLVNHMEFIFTIYNTKQWKLETLNHYKKEEKLKMD